VSTPGPAAPAIAFWPWGGEGEAAALERLRRAAAAGADVVVLDHTLGFAAALNELARSGIPADVVVVADACVLPGGWLERLRRAAHADDSIAAATALPSGAGEPLFRGSDGDPVLVSRPVAGDGGVATDGAASVAPVHPRLSRLWPHCVYIRKSALGLVGDFDESLAHPGAVLAEFAARALSRGLSCVLADDVAVERLDGGLPPCPADETEQVARGHPWIETARAEEDALELGPLRRALVAARVAGGPVSVTIDARAVGPDPAGTQTYAAGLVLALARSGDGPVRALVRDPRGSAIDEFERAGVELITESRAADGVARTDIAHRPQQAFVPEDLRLLRKLGERIVITHLDLISYRSPTYHESPDEWRRYRRLTRVALAACDRVVFLSDHARRDAISEDLIEPEYTTVCGVGLDREPADQPAHRPRPVPEGREVLVMIGSDYRHKNRLFAIELVGELHRRGWDGVLVLAGAHVAHGGSAAAEAELLRTRPDLAGHVVDIGPVSEPEKRWLLASAAALLCPSTYEGFGLTPLEAATDGIPCVYAPVTSLKEVAGADAATLVPWDAAASAERVLPLLHAGEARDRHLAALRGVLGRYRWEAIVAKLDEVYREAIASPYRSSVPRAWEELLVREQLIVDLDRRYQELRERVAFGIALIDRDGLLTRAQQRGLMRIAQRSWLRTPLLGPLGLIGGRGDAPEANSGPSSR
jgi:glycosyltransferase involved in cell wall biosynthesis